MIFEKYGRREKGGEETSREKDVYNKERNRREERKRPVGMRRSRMFIPLGAKEQVEETAYEMLSSFISVC